jgi:LemA protein
MGTIVLGAIGVLAVLAAVVYNDLLRRRNRVEQAYSTIDVQLTQRYDLIVKLVESVKQYMGHERSLLDEITRLRTRAAESTSADKRLEADGELTRALGKLQVTVENYPQLRASETFVQLQRSLNEVEEQLAAARRADNGAVVDYNTAVQAFPSSLVAGPMGFGLRRVFTADERKRGDVDMRSLFA